MNQIESPRAACDGRGRTGSPKEAPMSLMIDDLRGGYDFDDAAMWSH